MERVWRDLKEARAWLQFPTLEVQQAYIAALLRADETATLHSLPGNSYRVEAIYTLYL